MNKERVALIVLGFISVLGIYVGYELDAKDKQIVFDTMTDLLQSERDLEAVQNLKALEGLKENKVDEMIKFMEVRVGSALKYEGISE